MNNKYDKVKAVAVLSSAVVAIGMAASATAADVGGKDGWNVSFDGLINAFYISAKEDVNNAKESRIASGWDPSKFNAHISAPKQNGLAVTGNFQFASNIGGSAGSGISGGGAQDNIDVRVLDINIAGDFGSISIGRSWGIFNSQTTVNEYGSGNGVGGLCGGIGNTGGGSTPAGLIGGGQCGRIGYGYTWTAFAPRIEYGTPNMGGFSARVGLFDPVNPADAAGDPQFSTTTPRFEGEVTFAKDNFKLWGGFLHQKLKDGGIGSATIEGVDVGGNFKLAGLGVTAAYTKSEGFVGGKESLANLNCAGGTCNELEWDQWYVDVSYTVGPAMFGASTGRGEQDDTNFKGTLNMVYLHYNLTKQLVGTIEFDMQENKVGGSKVYDGTHWVVGAQYNF
jgi:hypothetical protein